MEEPVEGPLYEIGIHCVYLHADSGALAYLCGDSHLSGFSFCQTRLIAEKAGEVVEMRID